MNRLPVPQPDRESYLKHRQNVTRQIILPVVLVSLVGLGLAALAIYGAAGGNPGVSLWADISLIWLIIPTMVMMLVVLALLVGLIYGMAKLLGIAPRYTGMAQQYALWLNAEIVLWTDKIIQPILSFKAWLELLTKRGKV